MGTGGGLSLDMCCRPAPSTEIVENGTLYLRSVVRTSCKASVRVFTALSSLHW